MEDDFFPDFLEIEETESIDKVSSPKKEKKASSNSTKKEKALNTKDDDFELFSNEECNADKTIEERRSVAVSVDSLIVDFFREIRINNPIDGSKILFKQIRQS